MALIKSTAIVDSISGKIQGSVFAHNKGGAYIRGRGLVTNPQTAPQMNQRASFGGISQLWRGLTDAQRASWNQSTDDYPYQNRLGDLKTLSGFGLHQKLNLNLKLIGEDPISVPLSPVALPFPTDGEASTLTTASIVVQGDLDGNELAEANGVLFATEPMSPGVKNFKKRLRLIENAISLSGESSWSTGVDVIADYSDVFGTPTLGSRIGFKFVTISSATGQASPPIYFSAIVSA